MLTSLGATMADSSVVSYYKIVVDLGVSALLPLPTPMPFLTLVFLGKRLSLTSPYFCHTVLCSFFLNYIKMKDYMIIVLIFLFLKYLSSAIYYQYSLIFKMRMIIVLASRHAQRIRSQPKYRTSNIAFSKQRLAHRACLINGNPH